MISVLVVDDHELVRCGVVRLLEDAKGIKVVGEAASGEDAIKISRELEPDIALMDIRMPGIGGLEATRRIIKMDLGTQVIVLTAVNDDPFPKRLLEAGASGYVTKGTDVSEMVRAIKVVQAGQRYISPDIAQKLALSSFRKGSEGNCFDLLSERELQISMMIVSCHKVQEISDKLCLSPKTVNSYRYRLFDKLNISSDVELTLLALRHGMLDVQKVS